MECSENNNGENREFRNNNKNTEFRNYFSVSFTEKETGKNFLSRIVQSIKGEETKEESGKRLIKQTNQYNDITNNFIQSIKLPERKKYIDKDNNSYEFYIYPNNLTAFAFVRSNRIELKSYDKNFLPHRNCFFDESLQLYFCGAYFHYEENNIVKNIKCCPGNGLCIKCMKMNQFKHRIKRHYLININGRCCKYTNGAFHCYGHFYPNDSLKIKKNEVLLCRKDFICEACKIINLRVEYYFTKELIEHIKAKKERKI